MTQCRLLFSIRSHGRPRAARLDKTKLHTLTLRRVLELWIYYNTELVMICGAPGCRRRAKLDLIGMVDRYGAISTLGDLRRRLCCARCGAKRAEPFFVIESPRRFSDKWFPHPP